ncbi:MAG: DegV family protein [Ruminococcus sp.]|nr:DegV family protein [Ruminococcus sp.]
MAKIKLMTDSASDISFENEKKYDIKVMNFKLVMGDESYVSRVDFDNAKFYEMLNSYDGIPTHSQITSFEYLKEFEKYYKEGYTDIINVTINSNASATYSNSVMAAEMFYEEHPEAKDKINIYNIDSESYTAAYGYPLCRAASKISRGATAMEAVNYIKNYISKCVIYFAMYTLKYAKKSGRIPSAAAFVGEVMGLKPVMRICEGEIKTHEKIRGDKAIMPKLESIAAGEIIPQTPYCIIYGSDLNARDDMAQIMTKKLGYPPADFYQVGAVIASNAGPRVVGVMFRSRNR